MFILLIYYTTKKPFRQSAQGYLGEREIGGVQLSKVTLGGRFEVKVERGPPALEDVASGAEELADLLARDNFIGKLRDAWVASQVVDLLLMRVAGQGLGDTRHDPLVTETWSTIYEPNSSGSDQKQFTATANLGNFFMRHSKLVQQREKLLPMLLGLIKSRHVHFLLRVYAAWGDLPLANSFKFKKIYKKKITLLLFLKLQHS